MGYRFGELGYEAKYGGDKNAAAHVGYEVSSADPT
jgi:hypothetical protein